MADSSFDVVSKVDLQEADNALKQAAKELANRFDFRGTNTKIQWTGDEAVMLESETDQRCKAAIEVFKEKLIKRGVSLKAIDLGEPTRSGQVYRVTGKLVQGIAQDTAKKISKKIRDEGPKGMQAQIQGDQLRVSAKKKDDLQSVMQMLKSSDFEVALQFENFR